MLTVAVELPLAARVEVDGDTAQVGWKAALLVVIEHESATLPE